MKPLLLLLLTLTLSTILIGAEIVPVWNTTVEGDVKDMDFLKGQNEILMLVGEGSKGQIQRRNPDNGELIHSFNYPLSSSTKFAITPDSLRFIHINGNGALLRGIDEDFTILKYFEVKQEDTIRITFSVIAVDPIRPIAYVTTYGWNKNNNLPAPRGKVIAYNYETGEHIKDLTPYGEYEYTAIEVSDDGRYLATLNDNKAYLKVWDLNTMEQIIDEPLFDNSNDWCFAEDIYFSKVDKNVIYLSGDFSKKVASNENGQGTFKFNLNNKSRELLLPDAIYASGNLVMLENETIIFNTSTSRIAVLNLITNRLDWYGFPPKKVYPENTIYNENEKYFIGSGGNDLSKYKYDNITSTEIYDEEEIRITPNPTNSTVSLKIECTEPIINFQIYDTNGNSLIRSTIENQIGDLQFDFSTYPSGVYFLTIQCDNQIKTYKIVKEG